MLSAPRPCAPRAYNDYVDRDIDARVERTANRPLPSGQISPEGAIGFTVATALIGLAVLVNFNSFTIWLAIASLLIVMVYPFAKRFTSYPQIVLGLAFNWGALVGWAAIEGSIGLPPLALYAGCVFWTVGYDTIYAHQDKEDDALLGLGSTALKFGDDTVSFVGGMYGLRACCGSWPEHSPARISYIFWLSCWFFYRCHGRSRRSTSTIRRIAFGASSQIATSGSRFSPGWSRIWRCHGLAGLS